jgi:hypothetical protein
MSHIRLPDPKDVDEMLAGVDKRSEMAEHKLKTAIKNALASMNDADKHQLLVHPDVNLGVAAVDGLLSRPRVDARGLGQLKALIATMQAMDASGLRLYPKVDEENRQLTSQEKKDIRALSGAVQQTMRAIARGVYDTFVQNVFGDAHKEEAKRIFEAAADALNALTPYPFGFLGHITVDAIHKREVWCAGALTKPGQMALAPSTVADAARDQTIGGRAFLTLVHESTHALQNNKTSDHMYAHHAGFLTASAQIKLNNADHYREVVHQIATGQGRIFKPGDVSPHIDDKRSKELMAAAASADQILNAAWITAMRIHSRIHAMAHRPGFHAEGDWETWLRNASRLMGTTVHREGHIQFHSPLIGAATGPKITSGDLARIDNRIAMLADCNGGAVSVRLEPPTGHPARSNPSAFVDYVLEQVVKDRWTDRGLKFSKSVEKDVAIIRSLAMLHETFNSGKSMLEDLLKQRLPEPMQEYEASRDLGAITI